MSDSNFNTAGTRLALAVGGLTSPSGTMPRPDIDLRTQLNMHRTVVTEKVGSFANHNLPSSVQLGAARPNVSAEILDALENHQLTFWQGEEAFIPSGHVAESYIRSQYGSIDLDMLKGLVGDPTCVFGIPILEVEDPEGLVLRSVRFETRVAHAECPVEVPARTIAIIPELALIRHPRCMTWVKDNPFKAMHHADPDRGVMERGVFLKARAEVEANEALAAFDTLFRYYSLNEELNRLDIWMNGNLPFGLEDHPKMDHYRMLLEKQIGHLRKGAAEWYEKGSPSAGVDYDIYVKGIAPNPGLLPLRLRWLIDECRKRGYKRVAEYGSIEGVSLFHLVMQAPDIEWHGFEVNPNNVRIGHELAARAVKDGVIRPGCFNLHEMGRGDMGDENFDAVALFEALEHNDEKDGAALLADAEALVRPGGMVFITTPCGNWSMFDDHTRDLELRKDHIRAMTVSRMTKFLTNHARIAPGTLKVEKVDNPSLHEANAWCVASYELEVR